MIDFIDPVLKSSVPGNEVVRKDVDGVTKVLFAVIAIAFLGWLGYVFINARLDTKSEETINIDPRINSIEIEGRQQPIQTFPEEN